MNRKNLSLVLGVLSLAWGLVGCNSGVAFEELSAEVATANCQGIYACGSTFGDFSQENCVTQLQASIDNGPFARLQGSIATGSVIYDGESAATCISSLSNMDCNAPRFASQAAACANIFVGTVASGSACDLDEECVGDSFCSSSSCPSAGTCTLRSAVGESCAIGGCQSGLGCNDGVCVTLTVETGCSSDFSCPLSQVCVDSVCSDRNAIQTAAVGETCTLDAAPRCQEGGVCVAVEIGEGGGLYECRAPVGAGEACFLGSANMCPVTHYCAVEPDVGLEGTCTVLPGDGEPCSSGRCAIGVTCVGGEICRTAKVNGASCSSPQECWSNTCQGGICTTPSLCSIED